MHIANIKGGFILSIYRGGLPPGGVVAPDSAPVFQKTLLVEPGVSSK